MSILGIKLDNNKIVRSYMSDTNTRLQSENLVKNPFTGKVKLIDKDDKSLVYLMIVDPVYPKYYQFGFLLLIIAFIFNEFRFTIWMLPGYIVSSTYFFYSPICTYVATWLGLQKRGFKKPPHIVSKVKLLRILA